MVCQLQRCRLISHWAETKLFEAVFMSTCDFFKILSSLGVREENSPVALRICRVHSVPCIRLHLLVHGERHDIRLQRRHVSALDPVLRCERLRLAHRLLAVPRTVRPHQAGGLGTPQGTYSELPQPPDPRVCVPKVAPFPGSLWFRKTKIV